MCLDCEPPGKDDLIEDKASLRLSQKFCLKRKSSCTFRDKRLLTPYNICSESLSKFTFKNALSLRIFRNFRDRLLLTPRTISNESLSFLWKPRNITNLRQPL